MNRLALSLVILSSALAFVEAEPGQQQDIIVRAYTKVAGNELGGLTPEQAGKQLRVWWQSQKTREFRIHSNLIRTQLPVLHPSDIGLQLDDKATVAHLPMQSATVVGDTAEKELEPTFVVSEPIPEKLVAMITKAIGKPRPARVTIRKGLVVQEPEVTETQIDAKAWPTAVLAAMKGNGVIELPLIQGPKRLDDATVSQITDVMASFSTRFPKKQWNRNANIKLASSKLDGVILLPGEKLSFNGTVGKRTIERGFKLAGVYKNGRHDTGIGGGICQVSTTLYNACIFSNVKIVHRSNHSMPVAYVPLGRDATVDYGNLDLIIQNDKPFPIAVSSAFEPGKLTFRILGKKDPGMTVKLVQEGGKSWDMGTKVIQDPKLPAGSREVVEKGSWGHSITTYRLIYKNGVLVDKQLLNRSYYGGGEKIIAVGPSPTSPVAPRAFTPLGSTNSGFQARPISRG